MAKGNASDEEIREGWLRVEFDMPIIKKVQEGEKVCVACYIRMPKYRDVVNVMGDVRLSQDKGMDDPMFPAIIIPALSAVETDGGELLDFTADDFLDLDLPSVAVLSGEFAKLSLGKERYEAAVARGDIKGLGRAMAGSAVEDGQPKRTRRGDEPNPSA